MSVMRRSWLAIIGTVILALAGATAWAATTVTKPPTLGSQLGSTVQLGATNVAVKAPVCPAGVAPANCTIVMTRATALASLTNGVGFPTTVKLPGELVGFTVGLAQLSSNPKTAASFIKTLDSKYGGVPEAQLTVLKPGAKDTWTVVAEGPTVKLQPYLGYVVQFPLSSPIRVSAGEAVALTVSTWAPILSYNLAAKYYAYRQSRRYTCSKPGTTQNAQLTVGSSTQYLCKYPGTRAEYSATELTTPVAPK